MKKKIILTILFIISLLPMLLNWFGDYSGGQLISGTMVLFNPITIIAILVYIICIWYKEGSKISKTLAVISLTSIILFVIYIFIDWQFKVASGKVDSQYIYIGFYLEEMASILMLAVYLRIINSKKIK